MRHNVFGHGILIGSFVFLLSSGMFAGYAAAQPATPEIQLNMSVLGDLQQQRALRYPGTAGFPPLKSPENTGISPLTEAPARTLVSNGTDKATNRLLTIEPAAGGARALPDPMIPVSKGTTAALEQTGATREPANGKPAAPLLISFPVQTGIRTNSLNPGLGASPLLPPPKRREDATPAVKAALPVATIPIVPRPGKKPVSPVTTEAVIRPPLPPRRPAIQQVSHIYAAKMRQQSAQQYKSVKQAAIVRGIPKMPAVPAPAVRAEILPKAEILPQDPLAQRLLQPDRFKMAKLINLVIRSNIIPQVILGKNKSVRQAPFPSRKPAVPASFMDGMEEYTLPFPSGENQIGDELAVTLIQNILPRLKKNPDLRLQIKGYAAPSGGSAGGARRISLARALSVRSWLLERGIASRRMDIRALGIEAGERPVDKVELVLFDPDSI